METCCFRAKRPDPFPLDVAPGETVRILIEFKAHEGPFRDEMEAHFDMDGRLETVVVMVEGKAVAR